MSRRYGIPSDDFSTLGSHVVRWMSAPFRLVWWIVKAIFVIILGGVGGIEGVVVSLLSTALKILLCSVVMWFGWNRGWTVAVGLQEISWMTALWCSLPLVPLVASTAPKTSS
jgi:hypothetical protein